MPTSLDELNVIKRTTNFQYRRDKEKRLDETCKSTFIRYRDVDTVLEV